MKSCINFFSAAVEHSLDEESWLTEISVSFLTSVIERFIAELFWSNFFDLIEWWNVVYFGGGEGGGMGGRLFMKQSYTFLWFLLSFLICLNPKHKPVSAFTQKVTHWHTLSDTNCVISSSCSLLLPLTSNFCLLEKKQRK